MPPSNGKRYISEGEFPAMKKDHRVRWAYMLLAFVSSILIALTGTESLTACVFTYIFALVALYAVLRFVGIICLLLFFTYSVSAQQSHVVHYDNYWRGLDTLSTGYTFLISPQEILIIDETTGDSKVYAVVSVVCDYEDLRHYVVLDEYDGQCVEVQFFQYKTITRHVGFFRPPDDRALGYRYWTDVHAEKPRPARN